jgi:hypothetical protein
MTLALFALSVAGTAQARRLALVIGNDSYQNVQPLKNARSDAKAIAADSEAQVADDAVPLQRIHPVLCWTA